MLCHIYLWSRMSQQCPSFKLENQGNLLILVLSDQANQLNKLKTMYLFAFMHSNSVQK